MSATTFILMTISAEIIYYYKMWFELVIFEIQILNCSIKVTWKDDQHKSSQCSRPYKSDL
jgi:hypothetical protein